MKLNITTLLLSLTLLFSSPLLWAEQINNEPLQKTLGLFRAALDKVQSYRAHMSFLDLRNGKQTQNQLYWFKRGGYMRLEQLGPYREGIALLALPGAKVKVRWDGMFLPFVISLDPSNSALSAVTGDKIWASDILSCFALLEIISAKHLVSYQIQETGMAPNKELVLDLKIRPVGNQYGLELTGVDEIQIILDAPISTLKRINRYAKGKLISTVIWTDVQVNPTFREGIFTF